MGCCAHFPLWLAIERVEISSPQSSCESRLYLSHSSIMEAKMYKVQFLTEFSEIFAMSGMVSFRSKFTSISGVRQNQDKNVCFFLGA